MDNVKNSGSNGLDIALLKKVAWFVFGWAITLTIIYGVIHTFTQDGPSVCVANAHEDCSDYEDQFR